MRIFVGGRALWVLNGLVFRAAQSIGIHRDGLKLNLSPFECEMRRRLWWHIFNCDARMAEDHGFTVGNTVTGTDIALPLNVDDCQLDPSMTELPEGKDGYTEMSFTLIIIEANVALSQLYQLAASNTDCPASETSRWETFRNLRQHFETKYLQHFNQNIPAQRAAWLIGQVLSRKIEFKTRTQWPQFASPPAPPVSQGAFEAREKHLLEACEILELSENFYSDDLVQGYHWICHTYPQTDIMMYILWHLCTKPQGPNVERAWKLVDHCFENENTHRDGWKWAVLEKLRQRSKSLRGSDFEDSEDYMASEHPSRIGPSMANHSAGQTGVDIELGPGMIWTPDQFDELDWSALVDNVDMQVYEF